MHNVPDGHGENENIETPGDRQKRGSMNKSKTNAAALAVLLAAAAMYLALICAAEWLVGRAINRHMDESGYTGTFNIADVTAWRPSYFYLHSMQSGYDGTFNSSDVTAWRPTDFNLSSMQSGYDGTFNSSDVTAW